MSVEDELSLGESVNEPVAEKTLDEAVKEFDLQAFIQGVRSRKITFRLYSRFDLDAEISLLRANIQECMQSGDYQTMKRHEVRLREAQKAFHASFVDLVIEERSKEWQARTVQEIKAKQPDLSPRAVEMELLARQIVEPVGFTGAYLVELGKVIPVQVNRLIKAWAELQDVPESEMSALTVF